jgi:DNA-binding transcriptional ArsR family regulator
MEKQDALAALAALAHETRLDVFRLLVQAGREGRPAGALAEALGVPPATLSFHLKELKSARVVSCRRDGRSLIYRADFAAMNALLAFLTENCCQGAECNPR